MNVVDEGEKCKRIILHRRVEGRAKGVRRTASFPQPGPFLSAEGVQERRGDEEVTRNGHLLA
jgi:hypothetical protein